MREKLHGLGLVGRKVGVKMVAELRICEESSTFAMIFKVTRKGFVLDP